MKQELSLDYNLICGLEIHVELKTKSKMFCGCKNDPFFAPQPNIYTCPVCLGMPGALPIPNKKTIEWIVKLGLFLHCQINHRSKFDRKNYFYPDLPKGYQISQYDLPFCYQGKVETSFGPVALERIHLEEDAGKLLHKKIGDHQCSLIDFNRSGVPLIEIVTKPVITSSAMAKEYAQNLQRIIRFLEISDCDMEKGAMRLEANISCQKKGETKLPNYKVEVKNINSFSFLESAINYETKRQLSLLRNGQTPIQETRGFNSLKGETFSMRKKEDAANYRYFFEPDIPPIELTNQIIKQWQQELPLSLNQIQKNWQENFNLSTKQALFFIKTTSNYLWANNLFILAKKNKIDTAKLANDLINKKIEFTFFNKITALVEKYQSIHQTTNANSNQVKILIKKILSNNKNAVKKYQNGEKKIIGFFIGQIIRELKIKIDVKQLQSLIIKLIEKEKI